MSGIKETPADMWFSRCVRERAEWKCERCGKQYTPPTSALQCSHFIGRGNWAVRLDPLNGVSLCYGCHVIVGSEPIYHNEFYTSIMGEAARQIVNEKRNNIALYKAMKRTRGKGDVAKHYKQEYERMMEVRAQGVTGRLEFQGWM